LLQAPLPRVLLARTFQARETFFGSALVLLQLVFLRPVFLSSNFLPL